ncbi:MAG: endonuclease/exonuclease/phosphatase family protein [Candidatus Thorarchaeota archaeon]
MDVSVGTFNLNNLFSRFNFQGEIKAIRDLETGLDSDIAYSFLSEDMWKVRTYRGKLVKAKESEEIDRIAERIKRIDVDVLAIQEAEDLDTLRMFNRYNLGGLYRHVVLIEGNDVRLIDVGILSKFPIGGVTSWRHAVHPNGSDKLVFGRDLLQVEILNSSRSKTLFTLFNNHLKSHYVDFKEDSATAEQRNNERRTIQAETIARIVKAETRPDSRFIILGDMNDPSDSDCLKPFTEDTELDLTNALSQPRETRPAKADTPPPSSKAWTHRFKPRGQPAHYELYDQIWISPHLKDSQTEAWIDRRKRHSGDGSDHDPAWITLSLR